MKLLLFLFTLFFGVSCFAQKVYSVEYENQADAKVYVVNYENQADLKVYKVKYSNQAINNIGTHKHIYTHTQTHHSPLPQNVFCFLFFPEGN